MAEDWFYWYYVLDDARLGPVSTDQLKSFLRSPQGGERTLVWRKGLQDWKSAGEMPELASLFDVPPPLPSKLISRSVQLPAIEETLPVVEATHKHVNTGSTLSNVGYAAAGGLSVLAMFVLWGAYVVLGLFQIAAFLTGMELWLGLHWFPAGAIGIVLLAVVPFGSVLTTGVAFYGAWRGWRWEVWQAALLCFPFIILQFVLVGGAGLVAAFGSLTRRRTLV